MSRYVDADKLMEQVLKKKPEVAKVRYTEGFNDAIMRIRSMIHSAPTADVVEVRHGEWVVVTEERDTILGKTKLQHKECSVCGYPMGLCGSLYCGNCGAKMDGERKEK